MIGKIINSMIAYYEFDVRRINHFLKVYGFAKTIAEQEALSEEKKLITEVAAIVHDIGIKISEEKYNSSSGKYQELEGPSIAMQMLSSLNLDKDLIDRVCYLVGHHHTYDIIDDMDYQILVEADFLVNINEDNLDTHSILSIKNKIFKTPTGIQLLKLLYHV